MSPAKTKEWAVRSWLGEEDDEMCNNFIFKCYFLKEHLKYDTKI